MGYLINLTEALINLGYSLGNAIAMAGARVATKQTLGAIPYVGKVGSKITEPLVGAAAGLPHPGGSLADTRDGGWRQLAAG